LDASPVIQPISIKNIINEKITNANNEAKNILKKLFMINKLCTSKIDDIWCFQIPNMNTVFLLIGGNVGRKEENLERARKLIAQHCGFIEQSSSLYDTAPWGKTDQPSFLNQALEIKTALTAKELMQQILGVEKMIGRERMEKYGPRIIDIDILLFNNEVYDDPSLSIPHPEMQNRRFVLVPLTEIAANLQHPVLKKSISQLLEECPDQSKVKKYTVLKD
jgi:2-amino-4-hydroxy-6-hydroxymethyldihydropteridine diphosphokinase